MTLQPNDLLRVAVACSAAYGVLRSLPGTTDFAIAHILLLFAAFSTAFVAIILDSRSRNVVRSVASVGAWCFLGFGIGYVPVWYLQDTYTLSPSASSTTRATALAEKSLPSTTPEASVVAVVTLATPLPTAPPLPTDTPAPPSQCGQAAVRGVDELAIRDRPGLATRVIGSRPSGTVVELLCDAPVDVDGVTWRKVRTAGVEGWMSGRFLR